MKIFHPGSRLRIIYIFAKGGLGSLHYDQTRVEKILKKIANEKNKMKYPILQFQGGSIEDPPETSHNPQHYRTEGFKTVP